MTRTEVAVKQTKRWFNRWQIPIGTLFIAIASVCTGGIIVHYIDMYDVMKMRQNTRQMMDDKDARIIELAKQAGAAAHNASVAAENASKATIKAGKAADASSQAADTANQAAQTVSEIKSTGVEKWRR